MCCAATLGGCSLQPAPQISLVDARVAQRTEDGVVVEFDLEARNPGEVALPLKRVDYELLIDGRRVFEGSRSPEATLRRFGTQALRLPAVVGRDAGAELISGTRAVQLRGRVSYVEPDKLSEILFDTGIREPSVRLAGTRTLDFDAPIVEPPPPGREAASPARQAAPTEAKP